MQHQSRSKVISFHISSQILSLHFCLLRSASICILFPWSLILTSVYIPMPFFKVLCAENQADYVLYILGLSVGDYIKALECAKAYILFHADDVDVLDNVDYYESLLEDSTDPASIEAREVRPMFRAEIPSTATGFEEN